MKYYPINLDIRDRDCLVVGGGRVGTRKVEALMECGGRVTVVSTAASDPIHNFSRTGAVTLKLRPYRAADMDHCFLVIAATNNETLNRQIHQDANRLNKLCNVADRPEICNFILPAVVRRGDLVIAVSTSGKSPAFAKKMRKELEQRYGEEYEEFLDLMGAIRKRLLSEKHEPEAHKPIFEQLIAGNLPVLIRSRKTVEINVLLQKVLGSEYTLDSLT
jgi:precorrin-2 dehydrogenase / sirohydrochlorin ferrochelatase